MNLFDLIFVVYNVVGETCSLSDHCTVELTVTGGICSTSDSCAEEFVKKYGRRADPMECTCRNQLSTRLCHCCVACEVVKDMSLVCIPY